MSSLTFVVGYSDRGDLGSCGRGGADWSKACLLGIGESLMACLIPLLMYSVILGRGWPSQEPRLMLSKASWVNARTGAMLFPCGVNTMSSEAVL